MTDTIDLSVGLIALAVIAARYAMPDPSPDPDTGCTPAPRCDRCAYPDPTRGKVMWDGATGLNLCGSCWNAERPPAGTDSGNGNRSRDR